MITLAIAFATLVLLSVIEPVVLGLARLFSLYDVVQERRCHVYVLFGKVIGTISEPGFYFLPSVLGPSALIVRFFGQRHELDLRLDQQYLRSQAVNSEEGAPMGIGIWYEMFISDPVAYLFKNTDPRGSLRANVGSTTVRALSNMRLADMLETRHSMSLLVRNEVSPKAHEWGYKLGSVYIRKVHFRDHQMVRQIEEKVTNRLRQVTSAIMQDGVNQVNLIRGTAEREAAVEFARAATLRPQILGAALREMLLKPHVAAATFDVLETQQLLNSKTDVVLLPRTSSPLSVLLASQERENLP
ncbi:MAG: SPFH domain-containing protein [Polyangiaceae bacterium]|jgi:regulator of protease activity HflC (stomatin/prohibitin superfamily)|nr:SPFH domain-containing protein [Polyangiaceae bacterium]